MDQNVERRIRDRAYRIWEEEGCPEGRAVDHWLRAAQEIAAEEHEGSGSGSTDSGNTESGNAVTAAAEDTPKKARATRSTAKADKTTDSAGDQTAEKTTQKATDKTDEPAPKARRASKKAG